MNREELDSLSHRIIGLSVKLHKQLGPGFVEKIYEKALVLELKKSGIAFENQTIIKVAYEGVELGNQRVDFLVEKEIIVEVKTANLILAIYVDQLLSYLKTSDRRLGLILSFGGKKLQIKRVVNNF